MRRMIWSLAASLVLLSPMTAFAAMDHMAHDGNVVHEAVVDGVKATFSITSIADEMRAKGLTPPKRMTETHHLAATFVDVAGKKPLTKGLVAIRVQGPGQGSEPRELAAMDGHFGLDLDLLQPGSYGIMCRFVLDDGRKRQVMFRYDVKK